MKPKVAVFDFASCEGCELQIANLEEEILEVIDRVEIVSFREVMKEHSDDYDIAFVEGSINRPVDEERLKDIRSKAKVLIALGDCACTGCVNKLRNQWPVEEVMQEVYPGAEKQMENNEFFEVNRAKAVDEVVKVDFYIRGCPIRKEQFLYYVKRLAFMPPVTNKDMDFAITLRNMEIDDRSTVKYNPNKCILCRRCVNICQDVLGVDALGVVEKGGLAIISTPQNIGFDENGCIKCGQCVSVCPVGALGTESTVDSLMNELPNKKYSIAVDSLALASFVQNRPEIASMDPKTAENYVIAGLRHIGFKKIILYDNYMALSLEKDAKSNEPAIASWCPSTMNYMDKKKSKPLDINTKNAPWEILLAEEKEVCILTPCTALKDVNGFAHVLGAPHLDELFKQMELDLTFMDTKNGVYDGKAPGGLVHPGIPRNKGDFTINKGVVDALTASNEKGPANVYPCLMGCVNGGCSHPTIDMGELNQRVEWVKKLREVK